MAAGLRFGDGDGRQAVTGRDGRSQVFFCSSLPKWTIFATPSWEACTIAPIAALTRESSSMMMVLATCPAPIPPYARCTVAPIQP